MVPFLRRPPPKKQASSLQRVVHEVTRHSYASPQMSDGLTAEGWRLKAP